MIVLGGDVGKDTGLAVLDIGARVSCLHRETAEYGTVGEAVRDILAQYAVEIVGIETPSQVFQFGRGSKDMGTRRSIERALLSARDVSGVIRGTVQALAPSVRIFDGQAHEVRRAVCGKLPKHHIDRFIAAVVHAVVADWAPGNGDNDHNRDAAIVALWAAKLSTLPPSIARAKRGRKKS